MKKVFASIIVLFNFSLGIAQHTNQTIWTDKYKKNVFDKLMSVNDTSLEYTYKVQNCNCLVDKLSIKYPNGMPNTKIPNDVINEITTICSEEITNPVKWTKQFEESLKATFANSPEIRKLSSSRQKDLCNCLINELKREFPYGLPKKRSAAKMNDVVSKCQVK